MGPRLNDNQPMVTNIRRIISEKGLKQKSVAVNARFKENVFNNALNGRRVIKPCEIPYIAEALGVDVAALFMKEEEAHDTDS